MKKILSVFLAIVMAFSSIAVAAPSAIVVIDSSAELAVSSEGEADLMGAGYKVERGINMVTGNKGALTGENWSTYGGLFNTAYGDTTLSAADDPKEENGKVIKFNIPSPAREDRTGDYVNFRLQFGLNGGTKLPLSNFIDHNYMYVSYDVMKEVVDASLGYTNGDAAWIMNSSTASSTEAFYSFNGALTPDSGWVHVGGIMNLTWSNQNPSILTSTADPNEIVVFHAYVDNANGTDVNFYFDNMIFAPAYKVTYYNVAGDKVVKEDYIAVDENGNLLSSFEPEALVVDGSTFDGWATTVGGTPVDSISLDKNENIVLYATEEVNAFDGAYIAISDKPTKIGQKITASAVLFGNPQMDANSVTWASSDSSVLTVEKNKDGSATVTAVSEGSATITYRYHAGAINETLSKNIVVATGPVVDPGTKNLSYDTDMYEYITVNVTNPDDTESSIRVRYSTDVNTTMTAILITVPANAENMDVYIDMSEEENWEGILQQLAIGRYPIKDNNVEINNKKLWTKLSTELRLLFDDEVGFLGTPGYTHNVKVTVDCDLEGVYEKTYKWDWEVTNDCATVSVADDGSLNIMAGESKEGYVTITATSVEDENVSISRKIFVRTGEIEDGKEKLVGYKWDFNNPSNTGFSFSGHHAQSSFTGTSAKLIETAVEPGQAGSASGTNYESSRATLAASTLSGKSIYKITVSGNGAMSSNGSLKPTNLSMEEYPYLCLKVRTDNPDTYSVKVYLNTTEGESHTEGQTVTTSKYVDGDYTYMVLDASKIAAAHSGYFYNSMMFANTTYSVIDTSTIKNSGSYYYVESPITYSKPRALEIDEMFFANYDPSKEDEIPLLVGVDLNASSDEIVGESTVTLTPSVYSNEVIANYGVRYSTDKDIVTISLNNDGTATVTPVENGTVTIRATSMVDETAYDEITITISGVQKKLVAYDLSMVSLGNSYLSHGYAEWFNKTKYNGWIDETDVIRGMAASEPDLDYFGRIQYYVNNYFNCSLKAHRYANNLIEIAWKTGLKDQSDTSNHKDFDYAKAEKAILSAMTQQLAYIEKEKTNIITIQLAENAQFSKYGEIASFFYDTVFNAIDEVRPEGSVVVVITPFGSSDATNAEILKAQEYGFYVANCTDMTDKKWQAYDQYPDFYNPNASNDFRSHPGDLGMDEIGRRVFEQLKTAIPVTIPANYIYIPDSIEITGGNSITSEGGTLSLGIAATPSENSTTSVVWSVDDENIATIDENGVLTAVNDGEVNVTATCTYDESIKATLKVTVSGQKAAYTLTYEAGTTDEVTGIPSADAFAKGNYTLSMSAPDRVGYKFKGWSETPGGEVVKTVEMTSNKTVYATWEFADHWNFDVEGDLEGISFGGFHTYVRYEEIPGKVVGTVTSYGDGVTVFDTTLLIDSDKYNKFKITLQPTVTTNDDKLNLTLTNDSGKTFEYSLPMTSTAMTEYVFDISDAEGIITGLLIKPTVVELSLYIDEMGFAMTGEVTIDIGEKQDAENVRYAYINETEIRIEDTADKLTVELEGETIVRIVEKNGSSIVSEKYYHVNPANAACDELVNMKDYMKNVDEQDIRNPDEKTENFVGLRFKAKITTSSKKEADEFTITEHGFIVALERTLQKNNEKLTFDSVSDYVWGATFVKDSFDKVFDSTVDGIHTFAGVFYGIPEDEYETNIVARTYTKVAVNGKEFVLYGDEMVTNLFEVSGGNL